MRDRSYFITAAASAVCLAALLLPVVAAFGVAISGNAIGAVNVANQAVLMRNTLLVAGGAALLSIMLGLPVGAALARPFAGRRLLFALCLVSLLTPPYVLAVAWIDVLGVNGILMRMLRATPQPATSANITLYSRTGVAFVLAFAYYPIVAFVAAAAFRRFDGRWREAAQVAGRERAYFIRIALPLLAPHMATAAGAVFVLAMYGYPVHSLLQVDTFMVSIHASSALHDYRTATLLSFPLMGCALVMLALWHGLIRPRQAWLSGARRAGNGTGHTPFHHGLSVCAWLIALTISLVPIAIVAVRAMPPSTFARLLETAWQELAVTAMIAAVAATIISALGLSLALLTARRTIRPFVNAIGIAPFLCTGAILGIGLIAVYNRPGVLGAVYDSAGILVLAYVASYLFIAQWGLGAAIREQSPDMEHAALFARASWFRRQWSITVPLLRPQLVLVWGFAFVLCFREVDTAVLLAPPGLTPAPVRLFTLMHYGPDSYVMALSLVTTVVLFAVAAMAAGAANRISGSRYESG